MSKVLVTFSAPLIFLSSDQWSQIRAAIVVQCPLRDVAWKPSSRPATRSIPELEIELVGLDTIRDEHTSQIPQTLLEKPLLNLYIVTCEDNETYKNNVKKQIKDWHTIVSQRKNQEWLILLVIRPDARTTQGSFFALKSNVLDKIKADFNSDRKDRCVQLIWSQGAIAPSASAELIAKMKEMIMSAFDSAVVQRSEEVKRSENQRQMPGWNFCTFFILKESLASSFVGMNLPDDAILTYSELEASFFQTQNTLAGQRSISWFGNLINPDPKDDSLPILDIRKKPYRDLILKNTISVFDFRVYLLAKHCEVLGMSGHVSEMARKAASFLGAFGRRLKESHVELPRHFVESWTYSAALNVVDECDKWAELFQLDTSRTASFNAVKGELLELARIQLDKIGINVSHLPNSPPFSMSQSASVSVDSESSTPPSPTKPSVGQITSVDLLASLTDRNLFDKLYVDITNRAIDRYIKGGRRKFALKLHGSLAALDLHRTRYAQANQTYSSLPAHYLPHKWTSLATFMLCRRLETHTLLGGPRDREWAEAVLAFLKGFVEETLQEELNAQELLSSGDICEYVHHLVETVREAASGFNTDVVATDHPMFSVEIPHGVAKRAEDGDGSYLDIRIRNILPCDIVVDKIRLFLSDRDSEQLEFTASTQTLPSGTSTVSLFCLDSSFGLFVLDVSEISIGAVRLQWNHQLPSRQKELTVGRNCSSLVRVPRDREAVDIQIELPRLIQLGAPQSLLLTFRSGRNRIVRGVIRLGSASGIDFMTKDAEVKEANGASVQCDEVSIQVLGLERNKHMEINVPHGRHIGAETMKVAIQLEYYTSDAESSVARHARFTRHVTTSLPLVIQAHDHFRGKNLISKFTISTSPGTYQHLQISSVSLESVEDEQGAQLVIQGCRATKGRVVPVTPTRSANFLFHVHSEVPRTDYASMHLRIMYRLLREEVESLVRKHASSALRTLSLPQILAPDVTERIMKALEGDGTWLELYNATGELHIPRDFLKEINGAVDDTDEGELRTVIDTVVNSLRQRNPGEAVEGGRWREVIVPVDLPFKNVVSAAHIHLHMPPPIEPPSGPRNRHTPLFAGQPIAATLSINNSFHWRGPGTHGRKYVLRFDVKEMGKDWLISGQKRGDFVATDGSTHLVPLTLIPLHHGELGLPLVNVSPLPLTSGEVTMGSLALPSAEAHQIHGAERVLVLPRGGRTTFVVGMGGE